MSIFSKIYFEKRSNKFAEEMVQMIYHSILFIVSLSSVLFFLNLNHKFPSKFVLVFANILTFLAILSKYAIRKKIHAYLNKGIFYDHVLLVGSISGGGLVKTRHDFVSTHQENLDNGKMNEIEKYLEGLVLELK